MFTQREGRVEQEEIELRQRALKSLVTKRNRLLRESLDQRIKRAGKQGVWASLTRAECRDLHKQEIEHVRVQLADLQLEWTHAQKELSKLRRAMGRAERLRSNGGRMQARRRKPTASHQS
jgi:hypothetical protein